MRAGSPPSEMRASSRCGPTEAHAAAEVVRSRAAAERRGQAGSARRRRSASRSSGRSARHLRRRPGDQRLRGRRRGRRGGRARAPHPASTSWASQTSRVGSTSGDSRPPACFSRVVALLAGPVRRRGGARSWRGCRATSMSSRKRRRSAGAALHQRQVVGREHRHPQHAEQVAAAPSRWRLTRTRVRPAAPSSASTSSSRPSAGHLGPHDGGSSPCAPGRRSGRPGSCRAWPGRRWPPPGWSCPGRCRPARP